MIGVALFAFSVQNPGPIDETHGIENTINPPSGLVKKALATGTVILLIPTMSGMSTFAIFAVASFCLITVRHDTIYTVRRVFLITIAVFFVALLALSLFLLFRSGGEASIFLETHTVLSGEADSDGDGVPNWLEEITNSDVLNAESFPYNKDVVRAQKNTADALLYAGPGDFTEEIIQRFLFDVSGSASVTPEERNRFVDESAAYFLQAVEKKGLPDVVLSADDTVSRQAVFRSFVLAMRRFSGAKKPIDVLVFDVFSKNASVTEDARQARLSCDYTLQTLPRKVPQDVYTPYYLVLERVTYLCEALTVALTSATSENFFYALRLVGAGKLFEMVDEGVDDSTNQFILAVEQVVQLLEQSP